MTQENHYTWKNTTWKMKGTFLFIGSLLFASCFHETCDTKARRIGSLDYDFIITNSFDKDHSSWIVGVNKDGQKDTFQYYSFLFLSEVAKPNAQFVKRRGELIFTVTNDSLSYVLQWNCDNGGELIRVDTIR